MFNRVNPTQRDGLRPLRPSIAILRSMGLRHCTAIMAAVCLLVNFSMEPAAAQPKPAATASKPAAGQPRPKQVRIEYVPPANPAHNPYYEQLKRGRALESLQNLLSPMRLPYPLLLKVSGCDGVANAWYDDEVITVCYELLEQILKNAPENDLPIGITRSDTIVGMSLYFVLHEAGHAIFHMLEVPVMGREEDAADQIATFVLLRLEKEAARRMILGAAYQFKVLIPDQNVTMQLKAFSDNHSLPPQRLFNLLCVAYGADKKLFSDIVEKGFLPKRRAEACESEYDDLNFAFAKLIRPHVDQRLAQRLHKSWSRNVTKRRPHLQQKPSL